MNLSERFRTDYKNEIPIGEVRLYDLIDSNGAYIGKGVKLVRANGNLQEGDTFSSLEVNAIHEFLNGLLSGSEVVTRAKNADGVSWGGVSGKPSTYPPSSHSHAYSAITNKPSTYPPSSHTHLASQISGLPSSLPANGGNANTVGGYKITCQNVVINPGGSSSVRVPYPSSANTVFYAHAFVASATTYGGQVVNCYRDGRNLVFQMNEHPNINIQLDVVFIHN